MPETLESGRNSKTQKLSKLKSESKNPKFHDVSSDVKAHMYTCACIHRFARHSSLDTRGFESYLWCQGDPISHHGSQTAHKLHMKSIAVTIKGWLIDDRRVLNKIKTRRQNTAWAATDFITQLDPGV